MKQSTILEKVALVKRIQEMAGKVIEENGGHDIRFKPAEEESKNLEANK